MSHVTLKFPLTYTLPKHPTFHKGVKTPVPHELAVALDGNPNFDVELSVQAAGEVVVTKGKRPKSPAEVSVEILEAAAQLDVEDEASFTADGKPDARALTKILGWQVTSADRDEAMTKAVKKGGVRIVRKSKTEEGLDTGAEQGEAPPEETDPTTTQAVEV